MTKKKGACLGIKKEIKIVFKKSGERKMARTVF